MAIVSFYMMLFLYAIEFTLVGLVFLFTVISFIVGLCGLISSAGRRFNSKGYEKH